MTALAWIVAGLAGCHAIARTIAAKVRRWTH
jgi:hypothetical protein